METAEEKNRELAEVKARFMERQTQAKNYKRRVDVIDAAAQGPDRPNQTSRHDWRHGQRHRSRLAEHDERHRSSSAISKARP